MSSRRWSVVNGKAKGKRGELELCHVLKELFGWDASRSQQYNGNAGDSDLIVRQIPGLFLECKRVQSLNLSKAMALAVEQAGPKLPAVFHRKDREDWMITVRLSDLTALSQMVSQLSVMQAGRSGLTCRSDSISSQPAVRAG
jgi:hypothetical protein